jgi:hypothetical protein
MELLDIEKKTIEEFFNIESVYEKNSLNLNSISISKRIFTGSGFITYIDKNSLLKISKNNESYTWGKLGALINNDIDVGFLIYIDNGYITTLESYTYDREWPEEIISFDFYVINEK